MSNLVLFVLIEAYADWEGAYLTPELRNPFMNPTGSLDVKVVGLTKSPIQSMGGFHVIPDFDVSDVPSHFSGLVLIGGTSWRTEHAKKIIPLIQHAIQIGAVVGAICDASQFLATHGFLNHVRHTSNDLKDLLSIPNTQYNNQSHYQEFQVVRDGLFVTANGTASLEFAREMLVALGVYTEGQAKAYYDYYQLGHIEYMKLVNPKKS